MKKIFTCIFGSILLGYGGYHVLATLYFASVYTHTTGSVIDTITEYVPSQKYFVHPVVRFVARDGRAFTFTSPNGRRLADGANGSTIGDTVAVWYNPKHPSQALVYSFYLTWLMPTLLSLGGLGVLLSSTQSRPALSKKSDPSS